jgi:hypothetical protein
MKEMDMDIGPSTMSVTDQLTRGYLFEHFVCHEIQKPMGVESRPMHGHRILDDHKKR